MNKEGDGERDRHDSTQQGGRDLVLLEGPLDGVGWGVAGYYRHGDPYSSADCEYSHCCQHPRVFVTTLHATLQGKVVTGTLQGNLKQDRKADEPIRPIILRIWCSMKLWPFTRSATYSTPSRTNGGLHCIFRTRCNKGQLNFATVLRVGNTVKDVM